MIDLKLLSINNLLEVSSKIKIKFIMKVLKVRNKNAIIELLQGGINFKKILTANNLKQDNLTKEIILIARRRKIPIEVLPIKRMIKRRRDQARETLVGFIVLENLCSLKDLLSKLYKNNQDPFFLLINRIDYENSIGVIARTAYAAGVNGLFFQGDEDKFLNEETLHYSIGAIARIPIVKMNIFEVLKELRKNSIKTFCLQMGDNVYYKENLLGPVAFVLGAEKEGISDKVLEKCDRKISIPMKEGIDSLNVNVSAGIILYEKVRQDRNYAD